MVVNDTGHPRRVSCVSADFHNDTTDPSRPAYTYPVDLTYSTFVYTEAAHEAVRAYNLGERPEPYFLSLFYQAVHAPLEAPREWIEPVCNDSIIPDPGYALNQSVINRRTFCGMMRAADDGVGQVIDSIKRGAGRTNDSTLVVLFGDNGSQSHVGGSESTAVVVPAWHAGALSPRRVLGVRAGAVV
jgi:arylsulfatase A-like enzyme